MDTAAEGFFRLWLGRRSTDIIATAFLEPDHDLSFQRVTFAEWGGSVVGMVAGYSAEQHQRSSDRPFKRAAGFSPRMVVGAVVFAPLLRVLDTVEEGDFYLQAIAVDSEQRGRGVGGALLEWVEKRAVASGARRLVLDVSAKNQPARRVYERHGMSVVSHWPKGISLPGLRLVRMAKRLTA